MNYVNVSANLREKLACFKKEPLGIFPTPLQHIQSSSKSGFWVKNEGASHRLYGGNKVRKLEYLFALAKHKKSQRLVVWGDTTSHTVEAVVILGAECDFTIDVVVYPEHQLINSLSKQNNFAQTHTNVYQTNHFLSAFLLAKLKSLRPNSTYIPLGATTDYSTLGYVYAACEFVEQWQKQRLEWPKMIYLAMGSGGSVAGLAVGIALMDIPVKLNAVQTVDAAITNKRTLQKQISGVLNILGLKNIKAKPIIESHINIDNRFLGKGYGDLTEDSADAVAKAHDYGLELEQVHTGKVMAAILRDLIPGHQNDILYWHTHDNSNSVSCCE